MKYKVVYSESEVTKAIQELARTIRSTVDLSNTTVLVMLAGGDYLFNRLVECWKDDSDLLDDLKVEFIRGHSYNGSRRKNFIWDLYPDMDKVQGKNILVVDDFADSGNTINIINEQLKTMGAKDIKFTTLMKRYRCRLSDGVTLMPAINDQSDTFFVGCGLDDNGKARYINYIGAV